MKIVSQASLMERVTVTRQGCWVWVGARSKEGYGVLRSGDTQRPATRLFWESFVGIIPPGYRVLSRRLLKCAGKACCNPAHHRLQGPVVEKEIEVCKQGHPLTPENQVVENRNGRQFKRCRTCRERHGETGRNNIYPTLALRSRAITIPTFAPEPGTREAETVIGPLTDPRHLPYRALPNAEFSGQFLVVFRLTCREDRANINRR